MAARFPPPGSQPAAPAASPPSPAPPSGAPRTVPSDDAPRRAELGLATPERSGEGRGGWLFFAACCALVTGGLGWVFAARPAPRAEAPALTQQASTPRDTDGRTRAAAEELAPTSAAAPTEQPPGGASAAADPPPAATAPAPAARPPRAGSRPASRPPARGPSLGGIAGCGDDPLCGIDG